KMWVAFGLATIIGCAWITKMIAYRRILINPTIFAIPLLLFLLSQIISSVFSLDQHVSWWGYYSRFNGGLLSTITYIFLYFAFVSNFTSNKSTEDTRVKTVPLLIGLGIVAAGFVLSTLITGSDPSLVL